MPRIKQSGPAITTRAKAEDLVAEICTLQNDRRRTVADMDAAIQHIKDVYQPDLDSIDKDLPGKIALLQDWAEANPSEFGGNKSIEMTSGIVGWRTGNPTLKTISGWSWDRVLERLKAMPEMACAYIREKLEVNKEALLNDRDLIGPDKLRLFGMRVHQDERFFVDPKLTKVEEKITQAA